MNNVLAIGPLAAKDRLQRLMEMLADIHTAKAQLRTLQRRVQTW